MDGGLVKKQGLSYYTRREQKRKLKLTGDGTEKVKCKEGKVKGTKGEKVGGEKGKWTHCNTLSNLLQSAFMISFLILIVIYYITTC